MVSTVALQATSLGSIPSLSTTSVVKSAYTEWSQGLAMTLEHTKVLVKGRHPGESPITFVPPLAIVYDAKRKAD